MRALTHWPDDPDLVTRGAQIALDVRHDELARHCLPRLGGSPEDVLLKVMHLAQERDWVTLAGLGASGALDAIDGHDGHLARLLADTAAVRQMQPTHQRAALEEIIAGCDDDEALTVVAHAARDLGFDDLDREAYARAAAAIDDSSNVAARLNLAFAAESREDFATVIRVLDRHLSIEADTPGLRTLASAHANVGLVTERTLRFFSELPDSIREAAPYIEMEAYALLKVRDPAKALPRIDNALKLRPNSARLLLWRWRALMQLNREGEVETWIRGIDPNALTGNSAEKLSVAHVLARHGRASDAVALGYAVLAGEVSGPEAELLYCGLFFGFPEQRDPAWDISIVRDGVHLRVVDAYGQADAFTIDRTAQRSRDVVWPEDDRARPFLGLEVGAVVVEREGSPFERRRTVAEVKHRFIHLFHNILETFNDRHPGHPGLWRLMMPSSDPEQMLELVRRRSQGADESAKQYDTGVPLVAIANAEGSSAIDFMAYLESRPGGIRACVGTTGELREAAADIRAAVGGSGPFWT